MTTEFIPTYGSSHDPDDVATRNFDVGGMLRRVGGELAAQDVFLHDSNTDSALVISAIAYDEESQRVSYRVAGGTTTNRSFESDGVTPRAAYRITCRATLVDGRHYDQSAFLEISDH